MSQKQDKQIPGLIFEKAEFKSSGTANKKQEQNLSYDNYPNNSSRYLLWFGVLSLSIVIFVMWVLNAGVLISDISGEPSEAMGIVGTAKADLGSMIHELKQNDNPQIDEAASQDNAENEQPDPENEQKWQNFLSQILSSIRTSSSTTDTNTSTQDNMDDTANEVESEQSNQPNQEMSEEEAAMIRNAQKNT